MKYNDVKTFDQQLNLIFHAMLAGPLLFYCILYLNTLKGVVPDIEDPSMALKVSVSLFCGFLMLGAFYLYRRETGIARTMPTLRGKLKRLFTASMVQYAVIEFSSMIAVVAFYFTYDHLFTAIYVGILFLMSLNRPLPEKYAKDLALKGEERDIVRKKKELPGEGI